MKKFVVLLSTLLMTLSVSAYTVSVNLVLEDNTPVAAGINAGNYSGTSSIYVMYEAWWEESGYAGIYTPLYWQDTPELDVKNGACRNLNVTADITLTLVVEHKVVDLVTSVVGGTATQSHPNGIYSTTDTVTLTAAPEEGYYLAYWEVKESEGSKLVVLDEWASLIYADCMSPEGVEFMDVFPYRLEVVESRFNSAASIVQTLPEVISGYWVKPVFKPVPNDKQVYTITINATAPNGVKPLYRCGTKAQYVEGNYAFVYAPEVGDNYAFEGWSDGVKDVARWEPVTADKTYTAVYREMYASELTKKQTVSLSVAEGGGMVLCDWETSDAAPWVVNKEVDFNQELQIIAVPLANTRFVRWSDGNTIPVRVLHATEDINLQAYFDDTPTKYTIGSIVDEEQGMVTGTGKYNANEEFAITAIPNDGYRFVAWNTEEYGAYANPYIVDFATEEIWEQTEAPSGYRSYPYLQADDNAFTLSMHANPLPNVAYSDANFNPVFEAIPEGVATYEMTLQQTLNNGLRMVGAGKYMEGETANIVAMRWYNSRQFMGWSDGNTIDVWRQVKMTKDSTLTAIVEQNDYSLSGTFKLIVNSEDEAKGLALGTRTDYAGLNAAYSGAAYKIEAQPADGYEFDHWNDGSKMPVRFILMPAADITFTAYFKTAEQRFALSVLANNDTWGKVVGAGEYKAGEEVLIYAVPAEGYEFVQWNDGNTEPSRQVTISDMAAKNIYIATFKAQEATGFEPSPQGGGTHAVKILRNGQVLIVRDGRVYNILGVETK